ncbi:hypothetical protein B0H10DRAFT_2024255 [Mycena sp. CBHHK59/15]|nr:hypothetical protein B0H10DRAFT_2024255 [Mycena sp. CBHHK59/15]
MDFATNSAIRDVPTPQPPIWAHLFVMEKWKWFCDSSSAATAGSSYTLNSIPSDEEEQRPYRQFQKAADAIALISATGKDAQSVSACAIEIIILEGGNVQKYHIRIAKNGGVTSKFLKDTKALLDIAAKVVDTKDGHYWKALSKLEKTKEKAKIADLLLLSIIGRCRQEITDYLSASRRSETVSLKSWAQEVDMSYTNAELRPEVQEVIRTLCEEEEI